jgi:hypothetical protein
MALCLLFQPRMMIAAILFGTGIFVELCAVLLAPLGYQDEKGFHWLADGGEQQMQPNVQNPS